MPSKQKAPAFAGTKRAVGKKLHNTQAVVGGNQHGAAEKVQELGIQLREFRSPWHFKPAEIVSYETFKIWTSGSLTLQ